MKVTTYLQLQKVLIEHGFNKVSVGKHQKWTNGKYTIAVSNKHDRFSMYSAKQILKKAGINSEEL